jgi:hypothetical protein
MSCRVTGCQEDVRGQMLSCAAHWSLLSPALRDELVFAWDALEEAKAFDRPVFVAQLEHWHRLVARADMEWSAMRAHIRRRLLKRTPGTRQNGRVWARELRAITPQAPTEGDIAPDGNLEEAPRA